MTIRDVKRLLDEIDFQGPLYFVDINWKANRYDVKERFEWRMIIHSNEEITFGFGDNNAYELGRTVFRNKKQAQEYVNVLNTAGLELLK